MDETGFEVVDVNFEVVFSLDFRPPNVMAIQGVFYSGEGVQVIGCRDSDLCKMGFDYSGYNDGTLLTNTSEYRKIRDALKKVKPMFEYVGHDWFGKRLSFLVKYSG